MTLSRALRLTLGLFALLICASCGDTFRPVATPLVPSPTSPSATHAIYVLSSNGPNNGGASSHIDVSGDTNIGVAPLGLGPIHAVLMPNAIRMYIANSLEDTISSLPPNSIGPVTTTSLPTGSKPVFVHTTETGNIYVANFGNNTVGVIPTGTNLLLNPPLNVGLKPVALAETADGRKLYAANSGDGTVSSIDTVSRTVITTIPTGTSPVWAIARPDAVQTPPAGFRVYVLNSGSGTVSEIDSATDTVLGNVSVGVGANYMVYDKVRTRLYVVNPSSTSVAVLDASTDPPTAIGSIDLTVAPAGTALCAIAACHPVSIAVLPDASRAYVASYFLDNTQNPPVIEWQVSVANLLNNTIRTLAPLDPTQTQVQVDTANPTGCGTSPFGASPLPFRVSDVAAADGSQVYISNCDSGNVSVIRTSDDTLLIDSATNGLFSLFAPPSVFQSPAINISAATLNGSSVTYNYTPVSGSVFRVGQFLAVTGLASCPSSSSSTPPSNNGTFTITGLGAGTITVQNPFGCTLGSPQTGTGVPTLAQNPVFMLAGP
ncbi:MAG TPA: YncE family protein [Terriglobales bacterium]|nr:YncE family protein [Terriglobales bacterium]